MLPRAGILSLSRVVLPWTFCRAMSSSSTGGGTATTPPQSHVIAVGQLRTTSNKLKNLLDAAKCAGFGKSAGCSMLFLPECFGFLGESSEETLEQAEPPLPISTEKQNPPSVTKALKETVRASALGKEADDSTTDVDVNERIFLLDGIRTIARESNQFISCTIHVAGAPARDEEDDDCGGGMPPPRIYNTHIAVDNEGQLKCSYNKIHLFDVSIPGKVNLQESKTTAPGTVLVVCDSPVGKLGLSTCYDVRFPELYVELVKQGAQIILVPSAFTVPTGSAHWHVLLRARAIETQCYVVASAQFGKHNSKRESYGHSVVIDPWGKVLADAGGVDSPESSPAPDPPSIITCKIDHSQTESVRQRMPVQQHRAQAHYSLKKLPIV